MLNSAGNLAAVKNVTDTAGARPVGLLPKNYPTPNRANGSGAAVPNATYTGTDGRLATIAQTKYGAPSGWFTPAGRKGEGVIWTKPDGTTAYGKAPGVFKGA